MIDQAQLDILKQIADTAINSNGYPKNLRRTLPESFYKEGTKAAILSFLIESVENGKNPMSELLAAIKDENKGDKRGKPEITPPDPFTEKELEKRGKAAAPDFNTLKPPVKADVEKAATAAIGLNDVLRKKPQGPTPAALPARVEGEVWMDENDRWWKIIDGKKKQQKKPKS